MTTEQVVHYRELSAGYLRHARQLLAEGDLPQASEKAWGAAAVLVKAVAEARGWKHEGHRDLWTVVRRLVRETGDSDLRLHFGYAQTMHINFYEAAMEFEDVEQYLGEVERLVGKLNGLAQLFSYRLRTQLVQAYLLAQPADIRQIPLRRVHVDAYNLCLARQYSPLPLAGGAAEG